MRRLSLAVACCVLFSTPAKADELGFSEIFALSKDRTTALKQLIPGTEDHYYYHCLHYQNMEQFDRVDEMVGRWVKQFKTTPRVREIMNRQALMTYSQDPQKSLDYLRTRLNLQFNHQREVLGRQLQLPTELTQGSISRATLTERAFRNHRNLSGFSDSALDWLVASPRLNNDLRHEFLGRLSRPDYDKLAQMVVADLAYRNSRGFGSIAIHRLLLRDQLDECLRRRPQLLNDGNFINTYLTRLAPNNDVDWRHNVAEHEQYLDRLWAFVDRLSPSQNSLKAHILYHRLDFDRNRGIFDKQRFMKYIALPRAATYMNAEYMKRDENRRFAANLGADYSPATQFAPIGNDQALISHYLQYFFMSETSFDAYATYLNDTFLKHQFAEAKIINGLGEGERWYAMLPPAQYQQLKDRIDLDFAPTNEAVFGADSDVSLDLYIKNVPTLIVKVFRLNAMNFYRDNESPVNTDITLDGLVPNIERTYEYSELPERRIRRRFQFTELDEPGVYVVDFIGNGKSSRALLRKGTLRFTVEPLVAGHSFRVYDEANRPLKDARIWLSGHEYTAGDNGTITVPYSTRPGRQAIILAHGDFAVLEHFQHRAENYSLAAGIYVDRESLLNRKTANVVVRPSLRLNGAPTTLSVLEDVELIITSTDHDGVATTREISGFEIFEDRDSQFEFQVPPRLAAIQFELRARVKQLTTNKTVDLSTGETFALNAIDKTDQIDDFHLHKIGNDYYVETLGKTGEPLEAKPATLTLKHRDFKDTLSVTLQSNERGQIKLGALLDIETVSAGHHQWPLATDHHSYTRTVHGLEGETIEIPYMGDAKAAARGELALFELRGSTPVADRFNAISLERGMLQVKGLAAGDYELVMKRVNRQIRIRVTKGRAIGDYVVGQRRRLEVRNPKPLQIASLVSHDKGLNIQLTNASKFSRVHVFATRYHEAYPRFAYFNNVSDIEPFQMTLPPARTLYAAGRNIGDEYRYILDRKYATKYPGNLLPQPSLLLNPWPIRNTETERQDAAGGDEFGRRADQESSDASQAGGRNQQQSTGDAHSNLDFQAESASVLTNLVADENGIVTVPREALGTHQQVYVVAVDPDDTVVRSIALKDPTAEFLDLRLVDGLDPKEHFTQQKQVTVVPADQTFTIADVNTSRFEFYDTLDKVYNLYVTLSGDEKLIEFGFIMKWPELTDAEKRKNYSKYACHELNFFLFRKDPEFFQSVVRPYLANKQRQTFLDQWLLGANLSGHLEPWKYEQLNTVEAILLASRIDGEQHFTSTHIEQSLELIPADVERYGFLFSTALKGSALDTDDDFGIRGELDKLTEGKSNRYRAALGRTLAAPSAPGEPGGGGFGGGGGRGMDGADRGGGGLGGRRAQAAGKQVGEKLADQVNEKSRELKRKSLSLADKEVAEDYYKNLGDLQQAQQQQLYQAMDKTQEWVENHYYRLPIEQQNSALITTNAFWRDFAKHNLDQPFRSNHFPEAARNFPEMMLALAILDLPFKAGEHKTEFNEAELKLTAASPLFVFHEEIKPATSIAGQTPILVSQNFFRHGDRYRTVDGQQEDKYVSDEFLMHAVYGCQIVVTNPTSARQKLDLLMQIPVGALPVMNGQYTKSVHLDLEPFHTSTAEYYFYFPEAGQFEHYPVHVAKNEELLAFAQPVTLNVVREPTKIDRQSWAYVSQFGSEAEVIDFLKSKNLQNIDLAKIAFRLADKAFFNQVTELLARRHAYNDTLWAYGVKHNHPASINEYLKHQNQFVAETGEYLISPLLTIDPVERKQYEHMDYRPLVNARAHQLGQAREILNNRFYAQYERLLKILGYQRQPTADQRMALTYYMLLQSRVQEAIEYFEAVEVDELRTELQYDYFTAYMDFFNDQPQVAREVVEKYSDHPVEQWRNAFANVSSQLDEIEGQFVKVVDEKDRDQVQGGLAAREPSFDFRVESKKIQLDFQNLTDVQVNYYLMDVELLFSRNPFVQEYSGQFSYIRPNLSQQVTLPGEDSTVEIDLPEQVHNSNVLVEIVGAGQAKSQAYYSNSLSLQMIENYGQLRVADMKSRDPMPKVYVKVYARMKNGEVRFYKDGYTDLRGRFDYSSLNTNDLDFVSKFSVLVLSEQHGAVIREANPPKQ